MAVFGQVGRCRAAAAVRSEAEDERRSREQALPGSHHKGAGIGLFLRTVFFADYFVNPAFRRELLRVFNRGEATNALKRLIYIGRVANVVMYCNTAKKNAGHLRSLGATP